MTPLKGSVLNVHRSRWLHYLDLITFILEKASSQSKVDPKNAVKRKAIGRTEEANKF